MTDKNELPGLPEPAYIGYRDKTASAIFEASPHDEAADRYYTADQMREYALHALATRAPAAVAEGWRYLDIALDALKACDWTPEQIADGFSWEDMFGEHDPAHVWMPDGAGLDFNHHAINGVDQARAEFVSAACNAMLEMLAAAPAPAESKPAEPVVDKRALEYALNCLGIDNDCNTPDWQLADKIAEKMAEWPAIAALRGEGVG